MTRGKLCWYCKKAVMEDKGDYLQCPECGATFTELPKPTASPLTSPHDEVLAKLSGRNRRTGTPSKTAARRAAQARKAKESPLADSPLKRGKLIGLDRCE